MSLSAVMNELLERGQDGPRALLLVSGACLGRWKELLQPLLPLKQSPDPVCAWGGLPLPEASALGDENGILMQFMDWFCQFLCWMLLALKALRQWLQSLEGWRDRGSIWEPAVADLCHPWGQWAALGGQGRAVVLEEMALSAQHPKPASPPSSAQPSIHNLHLQPSSASGAQPCPLAAPAATPGCWVRAAPAPEPASIPKGLIN